MTFLRFEPFTLDLSANVLLRGSQQIALRPQSLKVLAYLARRSGQVLTHDELIKGCWDQPRQTDVNSLAQCIRDIRETLSDTRHELIATVPRRGYRFAAPVSMVNETTKPSREPSRPDVPDLNRQRSGHLPSRWVLPALLLGLALFGAGLLLLQARRPAVPTMMAEPSIAILPFVGETLAGLPMAADLTTELTRIPKSYVLRLLAASAPDVPAGKGGQEIGPRYQVSGNLRRVGGRLHLNVQLIDTTSNSPVWATQADFTPDEPGAEDRVRTQIARAIVVHVVSAEVRRPLPSPPQAGQLVLQGIDLLGGERGAAPNRDAKALFDRARMLDARFVPALLGCARTRLYEVLNSWAAKEQWPALLDEIELCLQDAANLEPYNPSVHAVRGQYLRARGKDPEAIAAFAHALSLYRLYPAALAELGRAKIEVGLASEAVPHIEDAIRLSPADPGLFAWYFWAGMADTHLGRYASAIDWLLKSRQAGRGFDITLFYLAIAYAGAGDMQQARAYLNEYRAIRPNFSVSGLSKVFFPGRSPVVAQQRARIVALLCALGAPGCAVAKTGLE